jgi:hypothetical protein
MKNLKVIGVIILLAVLVNACKKDSNSTTTSTTDAIAGSWRVSSFVKDSVDLTNQFNGYVFTCNANGGMTIQGNGNNYNNCSWNNSNGSTCHFNIMGCDSNSVLWEFDDDWTLNSHDSNHCYFSNEHSGHHSSMTWTKN